MDFTHEALKMAGALAVVIIILLVGLAWVRRIFGEVPGHGGEPLMRVLGGLRVGTGKQIMLVDVAGEVLVLGTTAKDMTLLTTITDKDHTTRLRGLATPVASRIGSWFAHGTGPHSERNESGVGSNPSSVRMAKCS